MQTRLRILQVVTRMGRGGAETMIMNYYRFLDREKYQFDFLVHREERADYDDEIEGMGGHIYRAFPIRPNSYCKYFSFLDHFFKDNASKYIAVHCHIQENSGWVLKYAAKYGIRNRLCTSHIANLGVDYKFPFRLLGKVFGNKYINKRLACGPEAGRYLYGNKNFEVFPNAIDVQKFIYSKEEYHNVRKKRHWEDRFIIGNVARFSKQKNHKFIIEVFEAIRKKQNNAILVLVGGGELNDRIKCLVAEKHLEEYVYFEGIQKEVSSYLKAFDVFLFPSLFEGLPVSIIEAQAAGLKCFLSDKIDKTVDITDNILFISLQKSAEYWAEIILKNYPYVKENTFEKLVQAGYDVKSNLSKLIELYEN